MLNFAENVRTKRRLKNIKAHIMENGVPYFELKWRKRTSFNLQAF